MKIGAVLTGDIIGSSRNRASFLVKLKAVLQEIDTTVSGGAHRYEIYRGDSFQYALPEPELALRIAILIRAGLRGSWVLPDDSLPIDARIAIGIGQMSNSTFKPGESNDEAFILSGRSLDQLENEKFHLAIAGGQEKERLTLELLSRWTDDMISRWSAASADTVYLHWLKQLNQSEIAAALQITQPGAHKRFQQAQIEQLELCEHTFRKIMEGYRS